MPYIITTTQALRDGERTVVDALESVGTRVVIGGKPIVSRTAVATLEEARQRVFEIAEPHGYAIAVPAVDIVREVGHPDPNRSGDVSGGTIGPLPDGTVIEVRQVAYADLLADMDRGALGLSAPAVLEAFNAA